MSKRKFRSNVDIAGEMKENRSKWFGFVERKNHDEKLLSR